MSYTYLLLNTIFLVAVVGILASFKLLHSRSVFMKTAGILLVLTLVFDPIIIALGIVDYNPDLLIGPNIFGAPVEDFIYSVLAALLIPAIWKLTERMNI